MKIYSKKRFNKYNKKTDTALVRKKTIYFQKFLQTISVLFFWIITVACVSVCVCTRAHVKQYKIIYLYINAHMCICVYGLIHRYFNSFIYVWKIVIYKPFQILLMFRDFIFLIIYSDCLLPQYHFLSKV